tara:strand:+ start:16 stop:375 length:360 start_codon:yes stop_codon:yes gene_type:complete
MKKFLTFFVIIFCLACDRSTPVVEPDQIIAPEIMEDIYFDLMLMKVIKNSNYVDEENKPYFVDQYIFKKYGIDSLKLIQNQTYYAQKPKMMKRIFENLEHRTKLIEDSIDTIIKREKLD